MMKYIKHVSTIILTRNNMNHLWIMSICFLYVSLNYTMNLTALENNPCDLLVSPTLIALTNMIPSTLNPSATTHSSNRNTNNNSTIAARNNRNDNDENLIKPNNNTTPHDPIRTHQCTRCPKKFKQRVHLETHTQAIHIGIKKIPCSVCNRKIQHNRNYQKHTRTAEHIRALALLHQSKLPLPQAK